MADTLRIDVRKSLQEAQTIALSMQQRGFTAQVDRYRQAIWNWSPAGSTPDQVASDADMEVFVVTTIA